MEDDKGGDYGTDPAHLSRADHPDTSHAAAVTVDTTRWEAEAHDCIRAAALIGNILDDVRSWFEERAPKHTQFVNRRTSLHQKGIVLDSGTRRKGAAGRLQAVYVARDLLEQSHIDFISQCPTAFNPCLWPKAALDGNDQELCEFYVMVYGVTAAHRDLKISMKAARLIKDAYVASFRDRLSARYGPVFWAQVSGERSE